MRSVFLVVIFSLSHLLLLSQVNSVLQVEYDVFYDTDVPNTRKNILQIDFKQNKSVFFQIESSLSSSEEINESEKSIFIQHGANQTPFVKVKGDSSEIVYNDFIRKETFLIIDDVQNYNWNLDYIETKQIGNILCNKATIDFRGRLYIAWYDTKIPTMFGPWKFRGLPGLIMQVYDQTKKYNWIATKISYVDENLFVDDFGEKKLNPITFGDFQNLKHQSIYNVNQSKLPRGTKITIEHSKEKQMERVF